MPRVGAFSFSPTGSAMGRRTPTTGERLRRLRRQRGLSLYEIARRLGRSYNFVWQAERGYRPLSRAEWHAVQRRLGVRHRRQRGRR